MTNNIRDKSPEAIRVSNSVKYAPLITTSKRKCSICGVRLIRHPRCVMCEILLHEPEIAPECTNEGCKKKHTAKVGELCIGCAVKEDQMELDKTSKV